MGWFVETSTYRREIEHPDSGETAWVELRPLDAGDRAEMMDTAGVKQDTEGEAVPDLRIGQMRIFTVEKALVDWSLPMPISAKAVRALDPAVFDLIFEAVSWGSPALEAEPPLSEQGAGAPDAGGSNGRSEISSEDGPSGIPSPESRPSSTGGASVSSPAGVAPSTSPQS